jgi:hypothetical protein
MRKKPRVATIAPAEAWWGLERSLHQHYGLFSLIVVLALAVNELNLFGGNVRGWDWLFVSGIVVLLVALRLGLELPNRFEQALTRLSHRGVLTGTATDAAQLRLGTHSRARRLGVPWAIGLAVLLIVAWAVVRRDNFAPYIVTTIVEAAAAALAGLFVGRAVGYGLLGRRVHMAGLQIRPEPQDFDDAAGLRPIGVFYLFQASILAVPGAFLAVWWFLIPLWGDRYDRWRTAYVALMIIVIVIEVIAFAAPMAAFHVIMRNAKIHLQVEADRYNEEAAGLRQRLADEIGDEREAVSNRLAWLEQRYHAIETMPTWPVDAGIRRRFTYNNAALLVPVILQTAGLSGPWANVIDKLTSGST